MGTRHFVLSSSFTEPLRNGGRHWICDDSSQCGHVGSGSHRSCRLRQSVLLGHILVNHHNLCPHAFV